MIPWLRRLKPGDYSSKIMDKLFRTEMGNFLLCDNPWHSQIWRQVVVHSKQNQNISWMLMKSRVMKIVLEARNSLRTSTAHKNQNLDFENGLIAIGVFIGKVIQTQCQGDSVLCRSIFPVLNCKESCLAERLAQIQTIINLSKHKGLP